ncbi:MAG: hypothetical protein OXG08_00595 [Gammaproteobacteria bacterium]|nr:hypothetical protein [Gammaproteobacteria bacterium]
MNRNLGTKPTRRHLIRFVASFGVTFVVLTGGFFLVSVSLSDESPQAKESATAPSEQSFSTRQVNPSPTRVAISIDRLADFGSIPSGFERLVALDRVLAQADERILKMQFVQSSSISPTSARFLVKQEILRRLASLDPSLAIGLLEDRSRLEQERLIGAVFREWSSASLDSATEHARTLEPLVLRQIAFGAMLEVKEDLTTVEKEAIGRHLGIADFARQRAVNASDIDAATSHAEIWSKTLSSNRPYNLKYWRLVQLAKARIDEEGLSAIESIGESLTDRRTRQGVLRESIEWAARSDPKSTFEYVLNSFKNTDSHLVTEALKQWVQREPENALRAISGIESSGLQKELYRNAVTAWSEYEPRGLLSNLEFLPKDMRFSARNTAYSKIRDFSPQEVTQLVAALPEGNRTSTIRAILGNWKDYAFDEAFDWALSYLELSQESRNSQPARGLDEFWSSVYHVGDTLTDVVLREVNPINAKLAFDRILRQSLDEDDVGMEANVVMHLVESDVDAAIELLPHIRNDKTREAAIKRVGHRLGLQGHWEIAGKFGSRLPKSQRPSFFDSVIYVRFDLVRSTLVKGDVVEIVAQIQSPELRSRAALWAIENGKAKKNLSRSDETLLWGYLTDDDKKEEQSIEITIVP